MNPKLNPARYAKAVASALVAAATFLASVLTADETLADITTQQWLLCLVAVGASFGIVYQVRNKEQP